MKKKKWSGDMVNRYYSSKFVVNPFDGVWHTGGLTDGRTDG